jgi:hypothetical protein
MRRCAKVGITVNVSAHLTHQARRRWIEAGGRFVKEHQLWSMKERAA